MNGIMNNNGDRTAEEMLKRSNHLSIDDKVETIISAHEIPYKPVAQPFRRHTNGTNHHYIEYAKYKDETVEMIIYKFKTNEIVEKKRTEIYMRQPTLLMPIAHRTEIVYVNEIIYSNHLDNAAHSDKALASDNDNQKEILQKMNPDLTIAVNRAYWAARAMQNQRKKE